jgi:hypothetical protein
MSIKGMYFVLACVFACSGMLFFSVDGSCTQFYFFSPGAVNPNLMKAVGAAFSVLGLVFAWRAGTIQKA